MKSFILCLVLVAVVFVIPAVEANAVGVKCGIWNCIPYCEVWIQYTVAGGWDPITEVWIFPDNISIDTTTPPTDDAPSEFGTWAYEYVYTCPFGVSKPLGGVKWSTTGPGLDMGADYDWEASFRAFLQGSTTDTSHDVFTYDSSTSSYTGYMDMPCIPEPATIALLGLGCLLMKKRRA